MTRLTFYHHVRLDGGERTGIEINDGPGLEFFRQETEDFDPALLWYVDLQCESDQLPDEPETVRQWFLDNEKPFASLLDDLAEQLEIGFDCEARPFRRRIESGPDGCRVLAVVSAIRRLQARKAAAGIREIKQNWRGLMERLASESVV